MSSTISTVVNPGITLGSGSYGTTLSITSAGTVSGGAASLFPMADGYGIITPGLDTIINAGLIAGNYPIGFTITGAAIDNTGTLTLENKGLISGSQPLGAVLPGVAIHSANSLYVINGGTISGGANTGLGGVGAAAIVASGTLSITNSADITGGDAGAPFNQAGAGGGAGIESAAVTTLANAGFNHRRYHAGW
jgi:hypothetical protein